MLQVKDRNIKMKFRKKLAWICVTHERFFCYERGLLIRFAKPVGWKRVLQILYGEDFDYA